MEYDLESPLENRLNWLSLIFLGTGVAMGSLSMSWRTTGNTAVLFMAAGLPLAVGILFMYLRSLFEDRLKVEGDQLISTRTRAGQTSELGRAPKASVIEAVMSQPSEHRKTTTLVLLLESGQLLELNCPERSQAEALVADLDVPLRTDLNDDVSVTRKQGCPTLRAKNNFDWAVRFGVGLIFLVLYLVMTIKLLGVK